MERRRNSKDVDLVAAIVTIVVLAIIFSPTDQMASFLKLAIWILLVAGVISGIALWQFRSRSVLQTKRPINRSQPTFTANATPVEGIPRPTGFANESPSPPLSSGTGNGPVGALSWNKELIGSLEWKRFEELCAGYFQAKDWHTRLTRLGADGGVDIYLYKTRSDTKPLGIIQCKAWNTYKVGVKPIRELYGVMAAEQTPLGIFMTSGTFTQEAKIFAAGKHVKLMTGDDLLKLILALPEDKQSSLLNTITHGDYTTPSCPSCGTKMIFRASSKGSNLGRQFWGCINFPRCRATLAYRKTYSSSTNSGRVARMMP